MMAQWPHFDQEQIDAVVAVLKSGKVNAWTGGDVTEFEAEYATYLNVPHTVAMANGSVTLNAALHALDLRPGDEVIVTPRSFVASASCVLLFGANPVFADIDPDTQNITPETIARCITPKTRGIIPVHLGGWPCDMEGIGALARSQGLWVIEDCAQAHGAQIGDRHVGTFGDFGSFSFCQDKIMTTGGEGGLLSVRDDALWRRVWSYKDHGKNYHSVFETDHPPGFRWLHDELGTNLRMTGLSAAIGRVQLARLDAWQAIRARNAAVLIAATRDIATLRTPEPPDGITHAWYRFYTFVRPDALAHGWSRDRIVAEVTAAGIPAFSGSCPEIYREKVFAASNPDHPRLPVAHDLGLTSIALLVDPTFDDTRMDEVGQTLARIARAAQR